MVVMLTLGEVLGVAATEPGEPLATTNQLRFSTAGAEATVAVGMSRLGHTTSWVGSVGDDEVGRRALRDLAGAGVDTSFVNVSSSSPTAFMLRNHRTPDFVAVSYYRSGSAGSQLCQEDVDGAFAGVDGIDIIHLTGITPMLSESARGATHRALDLAQAHGIPISFDVNYRRALGSVEAAHAELQTILPRVDILFVGDDEMPLLTDERDLQAAAHHLIETGPSEVVVKLGARGAFALERSGAVTHVDGLQVTVLDVIGAGDSFVAGYLAAWAEKRSVEERLTWGTACAACTVGTRGDWEGLPTRAELPTRLQPGQTIR